MNKKMRELQATIAAKIEEAKACDDMEKADAIMDEVEKLNKELAAMARIFEAEKNKVEVPEMTEVKDSVVEEAEEKKVEVTAEQMIAKQVRAIMKPAKYGTDKALNETMDVEGGYTVPEDIQTAVNHWPEVQYSLLADISEENVSTRTGARTYQALEDTDPFVDLEEMASMDDDYEIAAPHFERVPFVIKDRAGFMPVSNDLVADSDANIMAIVTDWLGRANVATANKEIKAILAAHNNPKGDGTYEAVAGATTISTGLDGIQKVINVILGQAYKNSAKIITNDDGLQWLSTLKDENGRYMLNPDPTAPAKMQLRCGVNVVPVKVIPNKMLSSEGNTVPMIIGDLAKGIRKYNRQSMTLKASDVAVIGSFNAFAQNMTLIRAIMRDDYRELDKNAYYYAVVSTQGN